jgi:multidrug transporter EmrE-like cation transporter
MKYGWILLFWSLNIITHVCLKFGSTGTTRWWPFFVIGNAFGITATLVLMKTYTGMNANVALGLCVGGGFLLAQTTILVVFRSVLSPGQIVGIMAIALGMGLLVMPSSHVEESPGTHTNRAADSLAADT